MNLLLAIASSVFTPEFLMPASMFAMWVRLEHRLTRIETKCSLKCPETDPDDEK